MSNELQNFLTLSYGELEDLNLAAKSQRQNRVPLHQIQEERLKYLADEKRIKAVTVLFSDLEGRLHMLDYDKKFLVKSYDNLTFDGSSIRGFTAQRESDLRLHMDWSAFYWGPSDVFGAGKVMVFGEVIDKDGTPYSADIRGVLKNYAQGLYDTKGLTLNAANEIEGFLFKGRDGILDHLERGRGAIVEFHDPDGELVRGRDIGRYQVIELFQFVGRQRPGAVAVAPSRRQFRALRQPLDAKRQPARPLERLQQGKKIQQNGTLHRWRPDDVGRGNAGEGRRADLFFT